MLAEDKEAVICDFAETYHIYDYKTLPPETAAILACGFREDSRIKAKLMGISVDHTTFLLTSIIDQLRILVWTNTKDAYKGRNQPKSLADKLIIKPETENLASYDTIDEFKKMRARIIGADHG